MNKIKVCHVITCLDQGGAQTMLLKLLAAKEFKENYDPYVFSFMGDGVLGSQIRQMGCKVFSVNTGFNLEILHSIIILAKFLKRESINVVQTWTYHSDLMGGIAAKLAGIKHVFWGVRHANLDWSVNSFSTIFCAYASVFFSYFIPSRIIYCSHLGKVVHERLGYKTNGKVIPNGFNSSRFHKSELHRSIARSKIGLQTNAMVIGCVGRFHPIKGQKLLLKAFRTLASDYPDLWLVFCGRGVEEELVGDLSGIDRVIFLPETRDIEQVYRIFDIFCLPSLGEAFPNVLAEAMLTENFCVASDVGDVSIILNHNGLVCMPNSVSALCTALRAALCMPEKDRQAMAKAGKDWVNREFSNQKVIDQFNELYDINNN